MVPVTRVVVTQDERRRAYDLMDEEFKYGKLAHGWLTERFETAFRNVSAAPTDHCLATGSGTTALEALFRTVNVKGTAVLCPVNTFSATAAAALSAGAARIEFVDCRAAGSPFPGVEQYREALFRARAERDPVAAAAWVHLGGHIDPEVARVRDYLLSEGVQLVEDAAHAHGCSLEGQFPGAWGVGAAYSFYPTKVITAGEGGMVVTRHESVGQTVQALRNHGKVRGEHWIVGYNYRISEANAAFGLVQSEALPAIAAERQRIYDRYARAMETHPVFRMVRPAAKCVSTHYKVMIVPRYFFDFDRAAARARMLAEFEVSTAGGVYDRPLNTEPAFADPATGQPHIKLPMAEWWCRSHVCLPIFRGMTDAQVDEVCRAVTECCK